VGELKEIFIIFFELPEEGEAVLIPDFPLKCHNASLKGTACPFRCLPPVKVVED
jgi:hypothetical protein